MQRLILNAFRNWMEGPLASYGFSDSKLYAGIQRRGLPQASLNAFLKTETDVQMKFGGFLESEILRNVRNLTVHAELRPYRFDPSWCADLSIHDISSGSLWTTSTPDPAVETTKAVIEIKFSNYRDPGYLFGNNCNDSIPRDLDKLARLQDGPARILLVLDEGRSIDMRHIDSALDFARRNGISILSNNDKLMHIAA